MRTVRTVVLVLIVLFLALNWSRLVRPADEPALLPSKSECWVLLGHGFGANGYLRQFNDGERVSDVIKLAGWPVAADRDGMLPLTEPLVPGQRLDLDVQGAEIKDVCISWMPAGQRVALGIPLHPDRMSLTDWQILPGVGAQTAARIIEDRQENGDFGSFAALSRIKGVGKHKMDSWKAFF